MDKRLAALLKCPRCEQARLTIEQGEIHCDDCSAQYHIKGGVPIMYHTAEQANAFSYKQTPQAITHYQSGFRRVLRSWKVESLVRSLWHIWIALDSKLAPSSPADPTYWMDRVRQSLPQSPKNVLDLGGGAGQYKEYLAADGDLYIILEVDHRVTSVQKNLDRNQYMIGDGQSDLFKNNSFDVIALFEVLEHVRNPFKIFANCANWLKPEGVLVLSTPQYWHVHGWPSDYFRYTIYGLKELASVSGLQIVDYWAMGGPCVMIWLAIQLNFSMFKFPIIRQCVAHPLSLVARLGDWVFFRNNLERANPDTRGWMIIARKVG